VAETVLKASIAAYPQLRYTAGGVASRLRLFCRFAPAFLLDAGGSEGTCALVSVAEMNERYHMKESRMSTESPFRFHGSCECGTCFFDVRATPKARFICHCKICQAFTGKPYSDVIVLPAKHVELANADQISFKKYRPPPNIERGLCLKCKKPVVEFGGFGAFKFAFIPTSNFVSQDLLPMPRMHIFYHRRLKDALDDLPKHRGYFRSQLAIGRMLVGSL
jgi:hypothetical protein